MGDDIFTKGRPHPMIDLNLRNKRLLKEALDPEVAVILFDLILGYGANPDPAREMEPVLKRMPKNIILVASICGTDLDPQNYSKQAEILVFRSGAPLQPTMQRTDRVLNSCTKVR